MALSSGTRVGCYEIAEEIGAGGMGVVYRATDTNLKRHVAIKVLPASVADDKERLARFQREAELLASLNHPNIAQIYGLERSGETTALVLELVEGPTLAERIEEGALPADEALGIAMQVAEALEAAHGQGIVHRDLKPANIKLRPDGTVKVLDFGIAKALEPAAVATDSQSPILTTPATLAGVILGTAAYMSPEQARGKPVDQRADIWAFGCVLYEMLTGQPAFGGEDVPLTIARVLDRDADTDSLPAAISPPVRQTIKLCLQKDVRKRVRDIGDVRLALEGAFETAPLHVVEAVSVLPLKRRALPVVVSILGTAVFVVFAGAMLGPGGLPGSSGISSAGVNRLAVVLGTTTESVGNTLLTAHIALSPDGRRLVYAAQTGGRTHLYVRDLDQLEARRLPGTDGAFYPFFSPDGEWVGFFGEYDAKLKKVALQGGPPQILADTPFSGGGAWLSDDTIIVGSGDPNIGRKLFSVPATGGAREVLIEPAPDTGHTNPDALPGGEAILFVLKSGPGGGDPATDGIIATLILATGEIRRLVEGGHTPRYVSTGHILFARAGGLWAVPFDAQRLEVTGPEVLVVDGVQQDGIRGGAAYAASSDGMLVYAPGGDRTTAQSTTLVWVDREGREEPLPVDLRPYIHPRVSPDGQRVAFTSSDPGNAADVWIHDLARGTSSRLTFDPAIDSDPVWSPDGERIVFRSTREGIELYWKSADGTGQDQRLVGTQQNLYPLSFTPDGGEILFFQADDDGWALRLQSTAGESDSRRLMDAEPIIWATLSPDGQWLAYDSQETGRREVYLRPFPDVEAGKWQVSSEGGEEPLWAPDGGELFFRGSQGVMAVTVDTTGPVPSLGIPDVLFVHNYVVIQRPTYSVSEDGERFLMVKSVAEEETLVPGVAQLVVVENWFEELRGRAPPAE